MTLAGPAWIALSGCAAQRPLSDETRRLPGGLLIFDMALPLLSATLLLDHAGPNGALSLLYDPGIGFGLMRREGQRLTRHMLPGAAASGNGSAQLCFRWGAGGDWSLGFSTPDGAGCTATGSAAPPVSGQLLVDACAAPGHQAAALLWFGVTAGPTPRPGPHLGPRTPIATPGGLVAAGTLRSGDSVLTRDDGPVPIRAIRHSTLPGQGSFAPVHLRAPFFGAATDLLVSGPQQIVVAGVEVEYLFGEDEVLVEARHLVDGTRVRLAPRPQSLPWISLDLGHEAVLMSGGCLLATAPSGSSPGINPKALRQIDAYEARALLAMHRRGATRSAA